MSPNWVQVVRDIAIIVLALESIIIGVLLVVLVFQVQILVRLLEHEIKPLLTSANETMGTVRGTTSFVSKSIVSPGIKVVSYVAAARQILKVLFRRRKTSSKPQGSE